MWLSPKKLMANFADLNYLKDFIITNAVIIGIAGAIYAFFIFSGKVDKNKKFIDTSGDNQLIDIVSAIKAKLIKNKEKKVKYAKDNGTYGTAGWQSVAEVESNTDFFNVNTNKGILLGFLRDTEKILTVPSNSFFNRNVAVYGSSGSMKSRSFVIPNVLNCILNEESLFVTDPKGELLRMTYHILKEHGYNVRALNFNNPECSDRWNILSEVTDDMSAITFAKAIISGSAGKKSDPFWDSGQENLLKALALYVVTELPKENRNMGSLYKLLTKKDAAKNLAIKFKGLPEDHVAVAPYNVFLESSDNEKVRAGMISGLATKLQIFQAEKFRRLTEVNEINLELPGRRKCAYFVVLPDSHASFDFMASLFFTFAFTKLMAAADKVGGTMNKQVNFILDEFPNIAPIPDFTKKISVIRSRGMNTFVIFQNIAQLQNRYPDGQWEEILGNCDNHVFLGCNENTTAQMISEKLGTTTVIDTNENKEKYSISLFEGREGKKYAKRNLMDANEVSNLDPFYSIVMPKGQHPIKMSKMDYTKHPLSKEMKDVPIYDMLKEWSSKYHKDWLIDMYGGYLLDRLELKEELQMLEKTKKDANFDKFKYKEKKEKYEKTLKAIRDIELNFSDKGIYIEDVVMKLQEKFQNFEIEELLKENSLFNVKMLEENYQENFKIRKNLNKKKEDLKLKQENLENEENKLNLMKKMQEDEKNEEIKRLKIQKRKEELDERKELEKLDLELQKYQQELLLKEAELSKKMEAIEEEKIKQEREIDNIVLNRQDLPGEDNTKEDKSYVNEDINDNIDIDEIHNDSEFNKEATNLGLPEYHYDNIEPKDKDTEEDGKDNCKVTEKSDSNDNATTINEFFNN